MVDSIDDISVEGASIGLTRYKIILIGDVSVGKTSVINRFVENRFKDVYEPSIGVDFCSKNILHKGKSIKLQIWDSAGQERYKSLIPTYVRGSSIVFIVYDICRKETFESVTSWISFVKNIENAIIVLCGNKADMKDDRKVETELGADLASREGLLFFEISAKTNLNVKQMFYTVIMDLPVFAQYGSNKEQLFKELDEENDENKVDYSIHNHDDVINGQLKIFPVGRNTRSSNCRC